MTVKRWFKAHEHAPGVRQTLDIAQRVYALARDRSAPGRPAADGGWPARLFSLPAAQRYTRTEMREIRRTMRAQNTSFSDGDAVRRFEHALAAHWKCKHAIAVSSGTSALHAALIAAEIRAGDEVIVPVLTHASTALAVLHQGAVPRFVDADPATWNIDATRIESAMGPRTRAIVAVHLCGVPCDMRAIRAIAERRGLVVIEDAAQAHGSRYDGRHVGTCSHLGCFSFQSAKTMTTGEGGAVLTDDDELARRVRLAMNVGESTTRGRATVDIAEFAPDTPLEYATLGWNYRMSALQAALGLGQLQRLDEMCAVRRANAALLGDALSPLVSVRAQSAPENADPCHSSYFIELTPDAPWQRDALAQSLVKERIDIRLPYAKPLAAHRIFGQTGSFPIAERICARALGFRVDPSLGRSEIETVAFAVRRLFEWRASH